MNGISVNHLQYADDSILIAPSPKGLQKLLNICQAYAMENDMIYNAKKTLCMCVRSKRFSKIDIPDVYLCGKSLDWMSKHKYLGVLLNSDFSDDCDIKRQIKSIYARGNTLIRKFGVASDDIKVQLFQAYCSNMYCCSLWQTFKVTSFKNIIIAYNKVFKYLLKKKGICSMSQLFVDHGVDHFKVLIRKFAHSLFVRVNNSANNIISTIVRSSYFLFDSIQYSHWVDILY